MIKNNNLKFVDNDEYYKINNINEKDPKKIFRKLNHYEELRKFFINIDFTSEKIGIGPHTINIIKNFMPQEDIDKLQYFHTKTKEFLNVDELKEANNLQNFYKNKIKQKCESLYDVKVKHDSFANRPHIDTFYTFKRMPGYVTDIHCDLVGKNLKSVQNQKYMWSGHFANLIYLNDNYDNGEIYFPEYKLKIKPETGMLISFPGHYFNRHGIFPASDNRFTMSVFLKYIDFK